MGQKNVIRREVPPPPRTYDTMVNEGTDESASDISRWLYDKFGVESYVLPASLEVKGRGPFVVISMGMRENIVLLPGEAVLVDITDGVEREPYSNQIKVEHRTAFKHRYDVVREEDITVPTDKETPFTTPQPPSETGLGKDSTPADDVAAVQEDTIAAEELATDE